METPLLKSGELHSEEEWEAIKARFVVLYKIQGNPLSKVRRILAEEHGFNATIRQYKGRIKKWAVFKKSDDNQHGIQQTSASRKPGGQRWNSNRNARGIVTVPVHQSPTLSFVHTLRQPGHLGAMHAATYGVSRFYSGVFHCETQAKEVRVQRDDWNIRQFFLVALSVSSSASAANWELTQIQYSQLLDFVVPMLQDRNPIIIVCLLQICARFLQLKQGPVLRRFLAFVVAMATAHGLDTHPVRLLASAWIQAGEYSEDLITLCSQQAIDALSAKLGFDHPQTLCAWRALYSSRYSHGDFAGALDAVTSLAGIEEKLDMGDAASIDAKIRVIECLLSMNELQVVTPKIDWLAKEYRKLAKEAEYDEEETLRLYLMIRAHQGELLRRQLDPGCIEIMEETLKAYNAMDLVATEDTSLIFFAEQHLKSARASLDKGQVESFYFSC